MQWPAITTEELPWYRDPDALEGVSKTARRKIAPTYEASVPLQIVDRSVAVPQDLLERLSELLVVLTRFDEAQKKRGYNLPALLLRSESAASSQIENLTSSVRNVALAEVANDAPRNAQLIAGNVAAMRKALAYEGELSVDTIKDVHRALINRAGQSFGGCVRTEQVWVGGSGLSPHGALYVPPQASRVGACLDDLIAFARREDMNSVVKAAIVHAQFETIHPFIDGNGRTGRTLVHIILRNDGVLGSSMLPVSAGLLHNIGEYMDALTAYQQGDPLAVVEQLADALELACAVGNMVAAEVDEVLGSWRDEMHERAGAAIYRLPNLLVEQPVVSREYLVEHLGLSSRACSSLISRACDYGMLRPVGSGQRSACYQSDDIIGIVEAVSGMSELRRTLARGGL